jgi:DNA-binding ferritin-like protein
MSKECDKHPINVKGYDSIDELAEEIGNLNYFSAKKLYEKLELIYLKQSEGDKKRERNKLSPNLEELSKTFSCVVKAIGKVCNTCKNYLKNPYKNSE